MKNAFFGGSFDPIHYGHLLIAEQILETYKLDQIYFCPTYLSPHKKVFFSTPMDRLKMVQLAITNNQYFSYLDLEVKRKGISYTIDTIKEIYETYKEKKLYMILSEELYKEINHWKNHKELLRLITLIKFHRYSIKDDLIIFPISSSIIRKRIREKKSIKYLVPDSVKDYIEKKRLYQK